MRRLYLSISLGILLALILASGIASQVLRYSFDKHISERIDSHEHSHVMLIKQRLDMVPESSLQSELTELQQSLPTPLKLISKDSKLLSARVVSALQTNTRTHEITENGKMDYILVQNGKHVAIFGPSKPPFPFSWNHLLIVVFIMIPIVGIVGYILTFPVARRLRILDEATKKLGEGDLSSRANINSGDAVGGLANRFNYMADKIESLLENQRHLIQAVSHELRTPIARIRFDLELLEFAEDQQERSEKSAEIKDGLDELNSLVDELFLYMRFESLNSPMKKEVFNVAEALDELAEGFEKEHPEINIKLQSELEHELYLDANKKYFIRAIGNLVGNAVRYAQTTVIINYFAGDNEVMVEVSDDGPGIPNDKREFLFEPFYRVDESRNRKSGGAGLGLAIVERILKAHNGSVSIADTDAGCLMITSWPLA